MASTHFDDLLAQMGPISRAVNAFTSESVQREAFQVLIAARGAVPKQAAATIAQGGSQEIVDRHPDRVSEVDLSSATRRGANSKKKSIPSLAKDLNLRPNGAVSFSDFVADKPP